nr:hypothetical protein [Tanacetum cinerariifolium]
MDNRKCIVNREYFREMMHICLRLPGQTFYELPFEEEILAFLRFLGHSGEIRKLTDVNINKLHQPWRSFPVVIKCLSGKSTGYDNFVYQVEHKDAKKSNEMYYPRFTKVIIHYFMTKDPSIPKRKQVNWHYVKDDQMFTTIKLVSRHQNTQQFGVMFPVELTNEDIRNSKAYKEYYAVASGAAQPKTKASIMKTKSSSNTTITPPTAAGTRRSTFVKGKQPAKASKAKSLIVLSEVAMTKVEQIKLATKRSLQQTHISQASGSCTYEGTGIIPGVPNVPTEESNEEISWKSSDEDDDDDDDDDVDERSDDQDDDNQDEGNDDDQDTDNEGNEFVHPKLSIHEEEETKDEESFDPIIQTLENSNDEGNDDASLGLNVGSGEGQDAEDDEDELYRDVNINLEGRDSSLVSSQFVTSMLNPSPDAGIDSLFETTPQMNVLASTTFTGAVSSILGIVQRYMDQRMNKAVKVAVQLQSDRLRDEAQAKNEEFLKNLDENIQKLIKEQVKEQVKVHVSKILPKIEKTVNEQLEAKVLTRSSNSSKTSYAVIADLSEMELKKILVEKIESNKSIHRSDEQRNLYKALVEAYESDKNILDTYGDIFTLKRHRDDGDKDEEPSAGSDRGSKRRREGKEPESTSALKEKATKTTSKSTQGSKSQQKTASESAPVEEPMQITQDLEEPSHQDFETYTLTPELLAGPTYELMKGSCKSLAELKFFLEEVYKATTDQLDWNNPEGQQYPHNLLKPLPLIPNSRGHRIIRFDHFINNELEYLCGGASSRKESARDVYSKRRIIAVTELQIVEWHNYKHLDWITVRRDDDKLYKFKEGDFKRLRIQEIEDMLLLLVQGKLTNLTVKERFAFNVSLRIDGTLNDNQTALDDRLKGIRMKYLPQAIWRKSDKERAAAMIQAIDKQLKTRRIMRSLDKFAGGRLYEGDFRMIQQTI